MEWINIEEEKPEGVRYDCLVECYGVHGVMDMAARTFEGKKNKRVHYFVCFWNGVDCFRTTDEHTSLEMKTVKRWAYINKENYIDYSLLEETQ